MKFLKNLGKALFGSSKPKPVAKPKAKAIKNAVRVAIEAVKEDLVGCLSKMEN